MANTIKIKRRTDATDNSALAALSVGELGVDLTDSNKLYVGSSSGNQLLNPSASTSYLPLAGGDLTGDLTLWGNFGANSTSALSTWTGRLKFDTDFSNIARGPNKVEIYNDGSAWIAGLGVHTNTVGFYSGNAFAWYKSNSQTAFAERMALDSSGNLTGAGTLGTNASRWSTIYGAAGDFSGTVTANAFSGNVTGNVTGYANRIYGGSGWQTVNLNTIADEAGEGELRYEQFSAASTNKPNTSDNANGVISVGLHSGNYTAQLAFSSDGNMYWRDNPNDNYGTWYKVWTAAHSLDAATLDSLDSTQFLRSDADDTATGTLTFAAQNTRFTYSGQPRLRSDNEFFFLRDSDGGAQAARFKGIQVSDTYNNAPPTNGIRFGTDTTLYRSAANTLSLGSDDSLKLGNSSKIKLGDSNDLQIFHDGSHSYVSDVGTGHLRLTGTNVLIEDGSGTDYIYAANDAVTLYNAGNIKLETTSAGVSVTGDLTVGGTATVGDDESTNQTHFTQLLTKAGLHIKTEYTANAFTPGLFWSTSNNNAVRPKAGIYLKETGSGTSIYFGTSNNYSAGITNDGLILDHAGNLTIGGTATVQPSAGDGILTLKNSAGSQILRLDQNSIRTTTNNHLTLFTNGNTNHLRLSSDGKIGVMCDPSATTMGNSKLVVAGVAQTGVMSDVMSVTVPNTAGNRGGYAVRNSAGGIVGSITGEVVTAGTYPNAVGKIDINVQNGGSSLKGLSIANNGNVSTPYRFTSSLLTVSNGAEVGGTMSLGSSQKLQWGDAATYITGSNSGDFLQFYPDGNVQLTLNSSGATIEDSLTVGGTITLASDSEHSLSKVTTSAVTGSSVETTDLRGRNIDLYAFDDINLRAGTSDTIRLFARNTTEKFTVKDEVVVNEGGEDVNFRVEGDSNSNLIVADASTDRVGIGTASPQKRLHIVGTATIRPNGSANNQHYFTTSTVNNPQYLMYNSAGTLINKFATASDSYITGGNFGIGGVSPSVSLDIVSTDAAPIKLYRNSGNCSVHVKNNGDDVYFGINDYDNAVIGHNLDQTAAPFQLTASGSLGLGTASPSEKLQVAGNVRATEFRTATGNNRTKIKFWDTTTHYGIGMYSGMTFGGLGNEYAMTFQFNNDADRGFWWGDSTHTNAQGAMALTTEGKLTVAHSMRLGFGESDTTTPGSAAKLDICSDDGTDHTDSTPDTLLRLRKKFLSSSDKDSAVNFDVSRYITGGNNRPRTRLDFVLSGDVGDTYDNSEPNVNVLSLRSDGRCGIGVTAPSEMLHIKSSEAASFIRFENSVAGGVYIGSRSNEMELYAGGAERLKIDSSGNLILSKGTGAYVQLKDSSQVRGSINVENGSDGLVFTTGSSFAERARITSTGLDVSGSINANNNLTISGTASVIDLENTSGGTQVGRITFDQTGNNKLVISTHYNNAANKIQLAPQNNIAATFLGSGKCGFGIETPDGTLHVHTASAGTVTADGDRDDLVIENSTNVGLTFLSPNTAKQAIAFGDPENSRVGLITYDHADNSLAVRCNNTDNLLKVTSTGVGIGGTPSSALTLHMTGGSYGSDATSGFIISNTSSGRATQRIRTVNNNAAELFFDVNGAARWDFSCRKSTYDYKLHLYRQASTPSYTAVSSPAMTWTQTGRVGIMDDDPAYELEVQGSISNYGDGKIIRLRSNDEIIGQIENRGTGADYDKGYFRLFDTGTAKVVLDSAGDSYFAGGSLGIGTTSPSAKLTIAGGQLGTTLNISQTHFRVQASLDGNTGYLELKDVRTAAGNAWTTSGRRLQMKIDSTYMGYIQWNGSGNNYGMSFGAGATTSHPGNVNEVMRIFSGANVSIGSTSSAYGRLFVDATSNVNSAAALAVRGRDSSASYIALNVMNNADGELFSVLNNGRAKFTGLVGINKTPAGYGETKLEVNGNVSGTRFLSGGAITNGSYAFEAYSSSFEKASMKLMEAGSGENEDPGVVLSKQQSASTGDHVGGIYFQGDSDLNYAIIRGTCAGSSKGQLNIHIAGQQNTITRTSNDTPVFQLGEGGLALGATPNDAYKLYVNGTSYFTNTAEFKSQINLITSNNTTRGFIKATDTNNAHLIIATSSGEDICFRDNGVNGTTNMTILGNGDIKLNGYGGGSRTGTVAKYLAVKDDGVIIETDGTGSGSVGKVTKVVTWNYPAGNDAGVSFSGSSASGTATITHNLGTKYVVVSAVDIDGHDTTAAGEQVDMGYNLIVKTPTTSTITLHWDGSSEPSSSAEFRVTIIG